jgi:TonB family protein
MPDDPMSETEAAKSAASNRLPLSQDAKPGTAGSGPESDLASLTALLTVHGGGRFSEQLSADLALEIVLNEIVEQACLTTGATGAAIVLLRDGEMVCRASSGSTAPELGTRIDGAAGISGECLRSRRLQRCDDALSDPRADLEACLLLGVRSVMLLPLLRDAEVVGLFEVFSAQAEAFSERDQRTLEALAYRVIKNLEGAEKPPALPSTPPPVEHALPSLTRAADCTDSHEASFGDIAAKPTRSRLDLVTWVLGLAVLACAIFVGVRLAERSGWMPEASQMHRGLAPSAAVSGGNESPRKENLPHSAGAPASTRPAAAASAEESSRKAKAMSSSAPSTTERAGTGELAAPAGGLRVYENGVEVFRMNPSQGKAESPDHGTESDIKLSSSLEPEGPLELPTSVAQNRLLYRVEPDYPEEARERRIEGSVVLQIHINPHGSVQEVKLVSGDALLGQAAVEAVKQWRFKPQIVHGRFVEMETTITLNFRLQR